MIHAIIAMFQTLNLICLIPMITGALFYIIKYKTDVSVIRPYGLSLIVGTALLYFTLFSNNALLIGLIFIITIPGSIAFAILVLHTIRLEGDPID